MAVPGGDAAGNRGWENAVADSSGRVFALWLDHRELAQQDGAVAASHHDHAAKTASSDAKPDGVAMAQRSKLYFASVDGAIAPRALTGGVCYCCKTALATAADGSISPRGVTCIPATSATSRSRGRATAAEHSRRRVRVSEDKWVLEGCPDDGPAIAVDAKNRVHIVWPTLVTDGNGSRTDDRAVLRDVGRRHAVHAAHAAPDPGDAAPSTDRDRIERIADDRVGRRRERQAPGCDRARCGGCRGDGSARRVVSDGGGVPGGRSRGRRDGAGLDRRIRSGVGDPRRARWSSSRRGSRCLQWHDRSVKDVARPWILIAACVVTALGVARGDRRHSARRAAAPAARGGRRRNRCWRRRRRVRSSCSSAWFRTTRSSTSSSRRSMRRTARAT